MSFRLPGCRFHGTSLSGGQLHGGPSVRFDEKYRTVLRHSVRVELFDADARRVFGLTAGRRGLRGRPFDVRNVAVAVERHVNERDYVEDDDD